MRPLTMAKIQWIDDAINPLYFCRSMLLRLVGISEKIGLDRLSATAPLASFRSHIRLNWPWNQRDGEFLPMPTSRRAYDLFRSLLSEASSSLTQRRSSCIRLLFLCFASQIRFLFRYMDVADSSYNHHTSYNNKGI